MMIEEKKSYEMKKKLSFVVSALKRAGQKWKSTKRETAVISYLRELAVNRVITR